MNPSEIPTPGSLEAPPAGASSPTVAPKPWLGSLALRTHLGLLGAFLATRLGLYALGLRFKLDLSWMFLSELSDLRERLLETLFYFHAFAPGMNLITGLLLKLMPEHVEAGATALFWASGALLCGSLYELSLELGLGRRAALGLGLAFSLLPQSLYLENLYLYTHLCTSLACAASALFLRAARTGRARTWFACFAICAWLGWLYTTFHLLWFGLMLLGAWLASARSARRRVLVAALAPGLLLFGLYFKNYLVFGVFGSTSWGGANLTLATTQSMPPAQRSQWIREHKLSPFASVNVFAPPRDYLPYLPRDLHFPWPGSNELWRPSVNAGNYNHGLFLEVNRQRREDSTYYIRRDPLGYIRTIFSKNLVGFFSSTTHWHPADKRPTGPHAQHRQLLGGYERVYDAVVHGVPPKVGLYALLPLLLVWASRESFRGLRALDTAVRQRALGIAFCLLQIGFVTSISCLFSSLESARYRYAIEPQIWGIAALGVQAIGGWWRTRRLERASR